MPSEITVQAKKKPANYLPARTVSDFSMNEQAILGNAVDAAGDMIARRQMSHLSRTDDTAITATVASLIYSGAYAIAAFLITGGLFVMAWIMRGGDGGIYLTAFSVAWGICVKEALAINRSQGLHHSSTGLAHHEIESRERVAMYTVDKHIELLEKRWEIEKD